MATMMQAYSDRTFVDDTMKPLVSGRLTVYVHDSNVLANVYTLEGSEYVRCDNPTRLDEAGRLQASLFTELGVYDVKLEKYNGDGTFEDFDWYEIGIDAKLDQIGRDSVSSIEELMALDPSISSKIVTVESYPVRNYLWDSEAVDTADGGVVVDSDVSDHGKWLLLWDCPYLPSSIYGVKDGDVTNINALFNYPSIIGSMNIHTPPAIRLESATYDLQNYYVCSKHLALEPGVRFTGSIGLYDDLELLGRNEPETSIGNFRFLHSGCTAHSSWYRTVNDFWHCGADYLYVDETNHFDYNGDKLSGVVGLTGKSVFGTGTKVGSYVNGVYFQVANDSDIPNNFFLPNKDYVKISATGVGDGIFRSTGVWDPGLINQGHHIQYDNVPDLDLFENTNRWVATMVERRNRLNSVQWSDYTLDLQGRTATDLTIATTGFTHVKNANFTGTVSLNGYGVSFTNVTATLTINSASADGLDLLLNDSKITVNRYHNKISGISAVNSNVSINGAEGIDPCVTSIEMNGGMWTGIIKMSTANCNAYQLQKNVSFRNVFIANAFSWRMNNIYMVNCTSASKIDLYPAAGGDNRYYFNCVLENNHFLGAFRLWLTYYHDSDHAHTAVKGNAVKFNNVRIIGNRFDTSDAHAIKMTMWHVAEVVPFMAQTYDSDNTGRFEYRGNTGNCPLMTPGMVANTDNWTETYTEHTSSTATVEWRKFNSPFYLWAPNTYLQGGTWNENRVNTMVNPTGDDYSNNSQFKYLLAEVLESDYGSSWIWYGYRRHNGVATTEYLEDEDYNNKFIVDVFVSYMLPSMTNYNAGLTLFPLPPTQA